MQELHLTSDEAEVLRDVLVHAISEMDIEILHTDTHGFKEMLKRRRALLDQVLVKATEKEMAA
jgi:hypothetical protein